MRIRSTKPEFWRSSTMAQFDMEDRLILKALESYVDDNGVGRDNVVIICADAFPHDLAKSPEIVAKVSGALQRFAEADIIVRYTVEGEPLVYVRYWKRWQYIDKPKAGRYPRPDGTMNYRQVVDETIGAAQAITVMPNREESPAPPVKRAKTSRKPVAKDPQIQSGEQGNRGTGEQEEDDPGPTEPPLDPYPATETVVDAEPPSRFAATPTPPKRHPTEAAKALIRLTLGVSHGYPRATFDRLAVQVDKLAHEGHPDTLIREAVVEWDRRPDCGKPEFLPTVLGDVVKQSRAVPAQPSSKLRAVADLAARQRATENAQLATTKEIG